MNKLICFFLSHRPNIYKVVSEFGFEATVPVYCMRCGKFGLFKPTITQTKVCKIVDYWIDWNRL